MSDVNYILIKLGTEICVCVRVYIHNTYTHIHTLQGYIQTERYLLSIRQWPLNGIQCKWMKARCGDKKQKSLQANKTDTFIDTLERLAPRTEREALVVMAVAHAQEGEKAVSGGVWGIHAQAPSILPASLQPQGSHWPCSFLEQRSATCVQCFYPGKPTQNSKFGDFIGDWSHRHNNHTLLKPQDPKREAGIQCPWWANEP